MAHLHGHDAWKTTEPTEEHGPYAACAGCEEPTPVPQLEDTGGYCRTCDAALMMVHRDTQTTYTPLGG